MHQVFVDDALMNDLLVEKLIGQKHDEDSHSFQQNIVCDVTETKNREKGHFQKEQIIIKTAKAMKDYNWLNRENLI